MSDDDESSILPFFLFLFIYTSGASQESTTKSHSDFSVKKGGRAGGEGGKNETMGANRFPAVAVQGPRGSSCGTGGGA